jgi:FixJ family two-component response regulator
MVLIHANIFRSPLTITEIEEASARIAKLTPRGQEVLCGILAGSSNKVIAHTLGISPRTVEIHRARMMRDLGVRHVADAIRLVVEALRFVQQAQHETPGVARLTADVKPFVQRTWK